MKQVGVYEAKTQLPRLLEEVELGAEITITRHGKPVAKLVPVTGPHAEVAEVIAGIRENRKGNRLDGLKVKDLIDEGRA